MVAAIRNKIFNTMRIEGKVEPAYKLIPHATVEKKERQGQGGKGGREEDSMNGDAKSAGKNFCWPKITKWQKATRQRREEKRRTRMKGDIWKIKTK